MAVDDDFFDDDALGMADQPMFDDQQRVSADEDDLRHYLADALVLLDDGEVLVEYIEPLSQREYKAAYARHGYGGSRWRP